MNAFFSKAIDKMMGPEATVCACDDAHALALFEGGASLLPGAPTMTLDTQLQTLASPEELKDVLQNLESVYVGGQSLANDILNNVSVGTLITHLDKRMVDKVIDTLWRAERKELLAKTHDDLESLKNTV